MNYTYETTEVCEFKLMDAFAYWVENANLTAWQVGEKFEIHPKYLWREYAKMKAKYAV